MSFIGESRGFAKSAREIAKQLKDPNLSANERAKLEKDLEWYEEESRFCWASACQEAKRDAWEDDHQHDHEPEDQDVDE